MFSAIYLKYPIKHDSKMSVSLFYLTNYHISTCTCNFTNRQMTAVKILRQIRKTQNYTFAVLTTLKNTLATETPNKNPPPS